MNVQEEYIDLMRIAGFTHAIPVSKQEEAEIQEQLKEEGTVPFDVYLEGEAHVRHQVVDMSSEELQKLFALKTFLAINTIKKCVIFFTVVAAISLLALLVVLINSR